MIFLLQLGIFHCYVSLPEGMLIHFYHHTFVAPQRSFRTIIATACISPALIFINTVTRTPRSDFCKMQQVSSRHSEKGQLPQGPLPVISRGTLPETNMAPENHWLEDVFSIEIALFRGHVSFRGCITPLSRVINLSYPFYFRPFIGIISPRGAHLVLLQAIFMGPS